MKVTTAQPGAISPDAMKNGASEHGEGQPGEDVLGDCATVAWHSGIVSRPEVVSADPAIGSRRRPVASEATGYVQPWRIAQRSDGLNQ